MNKPKFIGHEDCLTAQAIYGSFKSIKQFGDWVSILPLDDIPNCWNAVWVYLRDNVRVHSEHLADLFRRQVAAARPVNVEVVCLNLLWIPSFYVSLLVLDVEFSRGKHVRD